MSAANGSCRLAALVNYPKRKQHVLPDVRYALCVRCPVSVVCILTVNYLQRNSARFCFTIFLFIHLNDEQILYTSVVISFRIYHYPSVNVFHP
jgi:hypothetical protein